jgi:hypothetical protein
VRKEQHEGLAPSLRLLARDSLAHSLRAWLGDVDLDQSAGAEKENQRRSSLTISEASLPRFGMAGLPADAPLPEGAVTLRFVTPLRIKVRHRLTDRPRFRDLAFHMLRRVLEMAHWHVPGAAVDWEFYPLLQRCEEVRVAGADLRWLDWERWSQRQNAAMKLGGVVGTLTLEGNLAPFTSLLRAAEVLHAGKGATFGLGKVEVVEDAL